MTRELHTKLIFCALLFALASCSQYEFDNPVDTPLFPGEFLYYGRYSFIYGGPTVQRWNGEKWLDVGQAPSGVINAFAVYQGQLYVGGGLGGSPLWRWDGRTWTSVPGLSTSVQALVVFNGQLIVGGDGSAWDGTRWTSTPSPTGSGISCFAVYRNQLYACGYIAGSGSQAMVFRWDTTQWRAIGFSSSSGANAMVVYNDRLICGGNVLTSNGSEAQRLAAWDGASWEQFGSGNPDYVSSLAVYQGSLFLGGYGLSKWENGTWKTISGNLGGYAYKLLVFRDHLFAGGVYWMQGDNPNDQANQFGLIEYSPQGLTLWRSVPSDIRGLGAFER